MVSDDATLGACPRVATSSDDGGAGCGRRQRDRRLRRPGADGPLPRPCRERRLLVFWGALFGVFGVLVGTTSETTRAVFAARAADPSPTDGVRVVPVAAAIGAAAAFVLGVSGLWWGAHLFGDRWVGLLSVLLVGFVLFAVHCGLGGALAGRADWDRSPGWWPPSPPRGSLRRCGGSRRRFRHRFRRGECCGGGHLGDLRAGLAAIPAGGGCPRRRTAGTLSGSDPRRLLGGGRFRAAAGGFPVLLRVTTSDAEFAAAAPLILAVSLARAPCCSAGCLPDIAVTKVMMGGLRALRGPALVVVVATLAGVLLAYPVGRPCSAAQPDYQIAGATFSWLVVAAGLVSLLTLSGAVSLLSRGTRRTSLTGPPRPPLPRGALLPWRWRRERSSRYRDRSWVFRSTCSRRPVNCRPCEKPSLVLVDLLSYTGTKGGMETTPGSSIASWARWTPGSSSSGWPARRAARLDRRGSPAR